MERTKHKAAFVSSKDQHSVFLETEVHRLECLQLMTRRRGVPQSGTQPTASSGHAALGSMKKGPLVPHSTGMETRSASEHGPANWALFRHPRAIRGLLVCLAPITPGFTLRKAISPVTTGLSNLPSVLWDSLGFWGSTMGKEGGLELFPPAQAPGDVTALSLQATFFFSSGKCQEQLKS